MTASDGRFEVKGLQSFWLAKDDISVAKINWVSLDGDSLESREAQREGERRRLQQQFQKAVSGKNVKKNDPESVGLKVVADGLEYMASSIEYLARTLSEQVHMQRQFTDTAMLTQRYVRELVEQYATDLRIYQLKAEKWEKMYRDLLEDVEAQKGGSNDG